MKLPKLTFHFLLQGLFGLGSKTYPLNMEQILIDIPYEIFLTSITLYYMFL